MSRIIASCLLLWCYVISCSSQNLPQSPCPNNYRHEFDGYRYYGVLAVPNPPPFGSEMKLAVRLSIPARLPDSYVGKIELYESNNVVEQRMRHGQPIWYKIYFPLRYPIPNLVSATFNNRRICYGPPAYGPHATALHLYHTFSPEVSTGNNELEELVSGVWGNQNMAHISTSKPILVNYNNRPVEIVYVELDPNNPQQTLPQTTSTVPLTTTIPTTTTAIPPTAPPTTRPTIRTTTSSGSDFIFENNPVLSNRPNIEDKFQTERIPLDNICGTTSKIVPLVSHGTKASRGDWPWLVALFWRKRSTPGDIKKEFKCGATLISNKLVLTAAHCVTNNRNVAVRPEEILLKIGAYDIDDEADESAVTRRVFEIKVREDYNENQRFLNDLAVLILYQDVSYSNSIRPVCLWIGDDSQDIVIGKRGMVVGWGRDEEGSGVTAEPRVVGIPIVSTQTCRGSHPYFFHLTSNSTLCGGAKDGAGPCTGDSGGGLYMKQGDRWYIRGIVSKALKNEDNACNLFEYVIYTDTAKYLAWIKEIK